MYFYHLICWKECHCPHTFGAHSNQCVYIYIYLYFFDYYYSHYIYQPVTLCKRAYCRGYIVPADTLLHLWFYLLHLAILRSWPCSIQKQVECREGLHQTERRKTASLCRVLSDEWRWLLLSHQNLISSRSQFFSNFKKFSEWWLCICESAPWVLNGLRRW